MRTFEKSTLQNQTMHRVDMIYNIFLGKWIEGACVGPLHNITRCHLLPSSAQAQAQV